MRRFAPLLLLCLACPKKEPAPPPPPPAMCGQVEHGTDEIVGETLCAKSDDDEDGVDDAVDLCIDQKEIINGIFDLDGCPDPDQDLDLFVDYDDACVDKAGAVPDGCPFQDADDDTIEDHLDACPNEAEDIDGDADADGCPEGAPVVVNTLDEQLWRERTVAMRRGRTVPSKSGKAEYDLLIDDVLARQAEIVRAEIRVYLANGESNRLGNRRQRVLIDSLSEAGLSPAVMKTELRDRAGRPITRVRLFVKVGEAKID